MVLAVDVGSTSAKAQRFDAAGRPIGGPVRGPVALAADGTADPLAFLASVEAVVDEALRRPAPAPAAVALSCAWHGLVGLDGAGRPTTPLSTWQHSAAAGAAAELRRRLPDPDAVARRTGAPVHPSLPAARLLWEAGRDPEAFAATARWCSTGELLEGRWLAGAPGPSPSMASATGCYDQEAGGWDAEVLEAVGVSPAAFAPVDDSPRRGLAAPYRARWPALAGVPWLPALGDGACSVVGTGCSGARAALTVGTTAAVRVLTTPDRRAARPPALFAYLLEEAAGETVVVGAARSNAGNLVEWCRRVLRLDTGHQGLLEAVTARPPGSHGLVAVPSLAGERSPEWPLDASGSLAGLCHSTTALDVAAALLEAAALGVAAATDVLAAYAGPLTLVGSGRAVASTPAWRRLLADAVGRPLVVSAVEEASARGAALVALERLGWLDPSSERALDGDVVLPDPARAEAFAHLRP